MKQKLLNVTVILLMTSLATYGQAVTGRVTSAADGSALPGVSVLLKGTTIGSATDADGHFAITIPSSERDPVISFSFIGFATQEVVVGGRTTIDVVLVEDLTQLKEVVVTALGISRDKKELGYATNTIKSDQITIVGNTNFASALYGKAPGVKITTAPGGATSAVNVQIRGINSIKATGNQPLYVVDGVMIRNTEERLEGTNNGGYWNDQKIRGNGVLDINPADIESVDILKGASAAALYGSEASNGVILVTTKKGRKQNGLGVDVNYNYMVENVAFTPKYQNTYGPGYDRGTNASAGANAEGFIPVDLDGDGTAESERLYFRAYGQFGPKFDGRQVAWWDGTMRAYEAQPNNYKDFYQQGFSSNFNVALSNSTDRSSFRISYTRLGYEGISRGSDLNRNTFNLNGSFKLSNKVSADVVVNYINNDIHNRPEQLNRITANYGGFFSRADYMDAYLNKYQTSTGYKYVLFNQTERNPEEAIKYNIRASDLLEYFWRNLRDTDDEIQNRLITSATLNYEIVKGLKLRGRVGGDFTGTRNEIKRHNEYPVSFNTSQSTGSYTVAQGQYSVLYTDALLTYSKDITKDFKFSLMGGFQSRSQKYLDQRSNTEGGLVEENWFSLNNSYGVKNTTSTRTEAFMYAYLGMLNLSYKDYLFLEATARQEYTSTLPPDKNDYFYPSVNLGFVFSDAFQLPDFISYGKLRVSQARIANGTTPYASNVVYTQQSLSTTNGSVASLGAANSYGNSQIKPERKTETEFGLEAAFLRNKVAFDVTYYTNNVKDQIIDQSLAPSIGANTVLTNFGEIESKGVEIGITAVPFDNGTFRWDSRLTFAKNQTRVLKLAPDADEMTFYNLDAGAVLIKAKAGDVLGNIYVHPRETDDSGKPIIDGDGYYTFSTDYEKVGNIQPKALGGWSNTLSYKGFSLYFLLDYRFGGQLVSAPNLYAYGAGMYESTLKYRDEANGGLPYNVVNGENVLASSHAGAEYHDGVMLEGVTTTGEANTKIIDAPNYYLNMFTWAYGWYEKQAVLDNDYVKLREVSLSYNLPKSISDKVHFQNLRVSLIGRNLAYLYRTLENLDPEVAVGSNWLRQGIDEGSMAATRSFGFSISGSF